MKKPSTVMVSAWIDPVVRSYAREAAKEAGMPFSVFVEDALRRAALRVSGERLDSRLVNAKEELSAALRRVEEAEAPMPDITDERLAELEALAKAATPGPRRALPNPDWSGGVWAITTNPEHNWIQAINAGLAKAASKQNALFIAATDPDAVLSLVAEVKRLREALDESRRLTPYRRGYEDALRGPEVARMTDRLAESQASVAKLKEALRGLLEHADDPDCDETLGGMAGPLWQGDCGHCAPCVARAALAETEVSR